MAFLLEVADVLTVKNELHPMYGSVSKFGEWLQFREGDFLCVL